MQEYSKTYYVGAGECNPEGEMPLTMLLNCVIDVASLHANSWNIGYERLISENTVWVLSRVTVEMERYPQVNTQCTFTTWIEGYNRYFSQRNVMITDEQGAVLGYVRTIWMIINFSTRERVDISHFTDLTMRISQRPCPIEPISRLRPIEGNVVGQHTFGYVDCDSNRHINTLRYLEVLMNQFTLDFNDAMMVHRLELAFMRESRYGECVDIQRHDVTPTDIHFALSTAGQEHLRARFLWTPRATASSVES